MVHFLLNQKPIKADIVAPNMSVLEWLRTNMDLCGTKEGCASGDCGACTVVIGELCLDGMRYRTANACLMLMSGLQGKQLLTVEHVSSCQGQLHPVQQAMVECHGSQCGFCTPGFIMSLFALYENEAEYPGKDRVTEALGGNLCRCTGYQPILNAAQKAYEYPRTHSDHQDTIEALNALPLGLNSDDEPRLLVPYDLADLLAYNAAEPQAQIIAGGTDLSLAYTQQLKDPEKIIDLSHVNELKAIHDRDESIVIGAAVKYSDFLPLLLSYYPSVKEVFTRLGSEQIRNQGTLGGSLGNASPIGDPAPLLIALNASMALSRMHNGKVIDREVKVADFFTGYRQTVLQDGELIRSVSIPKPAANSETFFYKISKRYEDDISAVCFAFYIESDNGVITLARTGFGGMAATPVAAPSIEEILTDSEFSEQSFEKAAQQLNQDLKPMSDVRASKEYRLSVAENLIRRAWYESSACEQKMLVRVSHA